MRSRVAAGSSGSPLATGSQATAGRSPAGRGAPSGPRPRRPDTPRAGGRRRARAWRCAPSSGSAPRISVGTVTRSSRCAWCQGALSSRSASSRPGAPGGSRAPSCGRSRAPSRGWPRGPAPRRPGCGPRRRCPRRLDGNVLVGELERRVEQDQPLREAGVVRGGVGRDHAAQRMADDEFVAGPRPAASSASAVARRHRGLSPWPSRSGAIAPRSSGPAELPHRGAGRRDAVDQQDTGRLRAPPVDVQARHGTEWYVPFCSMSIRLWLAVLCGYFALGATIQALPSLLARGPGTLGLLVTLAAAATAVTRPFAGRLADRGRATRVARAGAALVAVGAAGHLVADGPPRSRCARLTIGAGEGALFTGALARVLEDAPDRAPRAPDRPLRPVDVGRPRARRRLWPRCGRARRQRRRAARCGSASRATAVAARGSR